MEREVRRRRIVERCSDRLALITGRVQSLDMDSPDSSILSLSPHYHENHNNCYSHSRTQSAPSLVDDLLFEDQNQPHLHRENDASCSSLNHEFADGVSGAESGLRNRMINGEASQEAVATFKDEVQSSAVDASVAAQRFLRAGGGLFNCFKPKEINSCIIYSENTRVFCSIMIALLVVIAYANLPHHIVKTKSMIASRPLYVLLLTDLMIVILRLHFLMKQKGSKMAKTKPKSTFEEDGCNWAEAIKFMEWGLVLYQTVRAIFIDCSFYTVIVVCGFSLN